MEDAVVVPRALMVLLEAAMAEVAVNTLRMGPPPEAAADAVVDGLEMWWGCGGIADVGVVPGLAEAPALGFLPLMLLMPPVRESVCLRLVAADPDFVR